MLTYNDSGGPGVEQENGTNQEGAGQHHADGQQEPVSEADVLLPEEEGVSVGVVEHALAAKLITDGAHTLDGFHKVAGLAKTIQVEGELGELQRFCCWDCKKDGEGLTSGHWLYKLASSFTETIQDKTLTAQIFPCSVVLVVNPLSGVRVEVGLGGSVAQRIITNPDCQVNVKHLRGDQTLCIHQPTRSQLEKKDSKSLIEFLATMPPTV